MKAKIIISLVVLIVVAVFAGNWIYGKNLANKIDEQLKVTISDNEWPVDLTYSSVSVNPMFSKVTLNDFTILNSNPNVTLKCIAVELEMPGKDALGMLQDSVIDEINSFGIQLKEIEILLADSEQGLTIENLTLDFNGHLTKADFENVKEQFPAEKQTLEFAFSNVSVDNFNFDQQQNAFTELQKQLSNLDKAKFVVEYNPTSKEIEFQEVSLSSSVLNSKSDVVLSYSGNGLDEFKLLSADVKTDYQLTPKDIHFEDGDNTIDFSLIKLAISTDFTVSFGTPSLPVGEIAFLTEGLKVNTTGGSSSILALPIPGASVENLEIERLAINYKLENENLTISDTELNSSIIGAVLNADVSIDESKTANSKINSAKLVVNKLSSELGGVVEMIENQMGKKLPRENDNIILEVTGTLGSPKIKGLEM